MAVQLTARWVEQQLPQRQPTAHKGTFGTLNIAAGSRHYRGAAALAVLGALRSGVGIVRLVAIEPVCAAVAAHTPCCIFSPAAENALGGLSEAALPSLLQAGHTALLAGCGLSDTPDTARLITGLLQQGASGLVLDADALNALARHTPRAPDWTYAGGEVVLTPHIGEMARLCGLPTEEVAGRQAELAT
ncbi:MAG: NAD(P)H-hydrate dehydratase, partial [Oscillospiraceae bacterium]